MAARDLWMARLENDVTLYQTKLQNLEYYIMSIVDHNAPYI